MRRVVIVLVLTAAVASGLAMSTPASAAARPLPSPVACPGCYAPALRTSWQWQLQFTVDTSFDVQLYDIDGFDATRALVRQLHADGRKVVCYFSAGSWENWRPDRTRFPASVLGRSNGWPGERWLDISRLGTLAPIMKRRLDRCEHKGFDAVEFDNVDGYQNKTGFPLTGRDQLRYDMWLANQSHRRGMSAVLKNDLGQVRRLLPYFDFALNEQCHQYHECRLLLPFVDAGKAVFGVEYGLEIGEFCARSNAANFNFLRKHMSLGPWRTPCRPD